MAWGAVTLFDDHRCKLLSQRFTHSAWTCMTMSDIGVTDSHKRPCVALRNAHYYISQDDTASSIWASK